MFDPIRIITNELAIGISFLETLDVVLFQVGRGTVGRTGSSSVCQQYTGFFQRFNIFVEDAGMVEDFTNRTNCSSFFHTIAQRLFLHHFTRSYFRFKYDAGCISVLLFILQHRVFIAVSGDFSFHRPGKVARHIRISSGKSAERRQAKCA